MTVAIEALRGPAMLDAIGDLACLRIAVFAEYPYLYDGDPAYEAQYLRDFAADPDSLLVAARDGARIVGAATASPLAAQDADFKAPFAKHGIDVDSTAYFGESVLLRAYRGQGVGHAFFDAREAHARDLGASAACFASIVRPVDHPARPPAHRALDPFWQARGYQPVAGLTVTMAWKDHGDQGETRKPLQVWWRRL